MLENIAHCRFSCESPSTANTSISPSFALLPSFLCLLLSLLLSLTACLLACLLCECAPAFVLSLLWHLPSWQGFLLPLQAPSSFFFCLSVVVHFLFLISLFLVPVRSNNNNYYNNNSHGERRRAGPWKACGDCSAAFAWMWLVLLCFNRNCVCSLAVSPLLLWCNLDSRFVWTSSSS